MNTVLPLEDHWAIASTSVVPVQSVKWYHNVLGTSGLEVIRLGYFAACNPLCIQPVWRELFELSWFHLCCNPRYTKNTTVLISKACAEWCWCTHTFEEQNWYALESSKLQVKAEFTETCQLPAWCPAILSFQGGMDATLLNYMCLFCVCVCVWGGGCYCPGIARAFSDGFILASSL